MDTTKPGKKKTKVWKKWGFRKKVRKFDTNMLNNVY